MNFVIYDQSIKDNDFLLDYIFDTISENLSFMFGNDMVNPQSRQDWLNYNLLNADLYWRIVIAFDGNKPCGYLIYTIQDNCFIVNDIEINKEYRMNPVLLRGLFVNAFDSEKGKWDTIKGYINNKNLVSKKNFLKLATEIKDEVNPKV